MYLKLALEYFILFLDGGILLLPQKIYFVSDLFH